jgi:hypothetical protein
MCILITLIEPGEVKVDHADFDLKLQENFLSTLYFFLTYSCRIVFRIFLNFWHDLEKWCLDVHFDVFSSEVSLRRPLLNPPPFHPVLLFIQTTWAKDKSRRAVVHSPVWHQ